MSTPFTMLVGGILPFGAVFIELFFIMSSVWLQRFYYVFGFLALVMLILLVTCAEIAIVLAYFQLCNEDYHWWWRSFLNSGAAGVIPLRLRVRLLLHAIGHGWLRPVPRVFWIHADRVAPLCADDGDGRLLRLVVVCVEDLRGGEGRLSER